MNSPLISVIVPIYNAAEFIEKTAEHLANQTYKNMEFILVDDGSTDGSSEICDKIAEKDSRFLIIHQKNSGVSAARNAGIAAAKGDYIGFCDSDDIPYEDMYETLYGIVEEYDCDVAMIKSAIHFIDGKVYDSSDGSMKVYSDKDEILKLFLLNKIQSSVYTNLFSAEICKQVQFPAPRKINEDRYYLFFALEKCKKLGFKNVTKYNYCRHEGSSATQSFSDKYLDIVYFADLIEDFVQKNYPELSDYARANKIVSYLRTCQLIVLLNGEKTYKDKFEEIRAFIKEQDKALCKKYLTKSFYMKYTFLKAGQVPFRLVIKAFSKF